MLQEETYASSDNNIRKLKSTGVTADDLLAFDPFSINKLYDRAVEELHDTSPNSELLVIDFEVSYTHFLKQNQRRLAGSDSVMKHIVLQHGALHQWEHAEAWPYKAQWMLGFYTSKKTFFWISNLEPFREKSQMYLAELRKVLETKKFVGQNIKYDLKILAEIMELTPAEILKIRVYDLMTMGYSLDLSAKRFSLQKAALRHLPIHADGDRQYFMIDGEMVEASWKQEEEFHRSLLDTRLEETIRYNRDDLLITKELFHVLLEKLRDKQITQSLYLYSWFIPFYTLLEMNGLRVDLDRAETAFFDSAEDGRLAELRVCENIVKLIQLLHDEHKVASTRAQITSKYSAYITSCAFFDFETFQFKAPTTAVVNSKAFTLQFAKATDYFSIRTVAGSLFREFISLLLITAFKQPVSSTKTGLAFQKDEINLLQKRLELSSVKSELLMAEILKDMLFLNSLKANLARVRAFYILPAFLYPDTRLHSNFKLLGTETGRISSSNPGIMNLPMRLKDLVVPDKKGKIIQLDLKSAEAKLFMLITQNREILEALLTNDDTYSVIGMKVFELEEMSKKTRPIERNIMKIGVLAKMYGQSIYGLAQQIEIFYAPAKWDIYVNKKKYHFLYSWKCVSYQEESTELLDQLADKIRQRQSELNFDSEAEAADLELSEWKQQLSDNIVLNYFAIAAISDQRLGVAIDSGKYEDWICQTFFNLENPSESYVRSPAGLIRPFDMTAENLIRENLTASEKADVYTLLCRVYRKFFLEVKAFVGSFWNGNENVDITCYRLAALSAFSKILKHELSGREVYMKQFNAMFEALDLKTDAEQDLLFRVTKSHELNYAFQRAAARLSARYREALNMPIQGTSSYINSYLGYQSYRECLNKGLDMRVINTVHDAVHFEVNTLEHIDEFKSIVSKVYLDVDLLRNLLHAGLKQIHPTIDKIRYISIGGDIEVCDKLSEAK